MKCVILKSFLGKWHSSCDNKGCFPKVFPFFPHLYEDKGKWCYWQLFQRRYIIFRRFFACFNDFEWMFSILQGNISLQGIYLIYELVFFTLMYVCLYASCAVYFLHMPHPSAQTKLFLSQINYFLSQTKYFLSQTKIFVPGLKAHICLGKE